MLRIGGWMGGGQEKNVDARKWIYQGNRWSLKRYFPISLGIWVIIVRQSTAATPLLYLPNWYRLFYIFPRYFGFCYYYRLWKLEKVNKQGASY